jgi:ABC-type uncharacterized transport system substrate-binding protein
MKSIVKELWLAVTLIMLTSAVLMMSDRQQRQKSVASSVKDFPAIAIMQITSTTLLDAHVAGVISRLKENGYYASEGRNIRRFNAQGDFSTANTIAREIANGPYDIVITSSTVALQVFSKANQTTRKPHVFGAVTDPYGAGVGITGSEPDQHPPYMAGIGTFQPVQRSFMLARELNPNLRRVGVVWNPGEQCSEACMAEAYIICQELGIELVEVIATNTSEVAEAVRSLLGKNIGAIWIGGDTVASSSIGMIISLAAQAGIPVFTNDHLDAVAGALFGLGANYFTVGEFTADIAVSILQGDNPASFRIENVIPEKFRLNQQVLSTLDANWRISPVIQALIDEDRGQLTRIAMISLVENPLLERAEAGVEMGLQESGLRSGEDYVIKHYSAQGDMAQLPQIIESAVRDKPDIIVTVTTPALIATSQRVKDIPIVFTVASDPIKLNLFTAGRPVNICGIHDDPPLDLLLKMAREYDKKLTTVGIIFDPSQMNAVISAEKLREAGKEQHIRVLEATVSGSSDLPMAVQSIIQRGAQAIILSADNLVYSGFPAIHKAASTANIPIFVTEPGLVKMGATGAIGDNFYEWGKESGKMAAQVISGVAPAQLPVRATRVYERIEPLTKQGKGTRYRIRLVHFSDTEFSERTAEGIKEGFHRAGMEKDRDYELRTYNAQGDMSTLSSIMNTVKSDRVDLLLVISTPALQAALRQAGSETNIVFASVGDGVLAGAGKSETDHLPNVTGITTRSPFADMAQLIRASVPGISKVGTLFTPAEINSVLYKDWFKEALAAEGIELVALPVTSSADVAQSAVELCSQNIQAVAQVVDNLTRPGFALIARRAAEKNIPVFVFDSDQMKDGGAVCLARDYFDSGLEAAEKAIRVLRGENPANIPFSNTKSLTIMIHPELVEKYGLQLPETFLEKARVYKP